MLYINEPVIFNFKPNVCYSIILVQTYHLLSTDKRDQVTRDLINFWSVNQNTVLTYHEKYGLPLCVCPTIK